MHQILKICRLAGVVYQNQIQKWSLFTDEIYHMKILVKYTTPANTISCIITSWVGCPRPALSVGHSPDSCVKTDWHTEHGHIRRVLVSWAASGWHARCLRRLPSLT